MADAPCMPLWVSDFLGSAACSEMDGDAKALYLLMLVHLWNLGERGLPTNEKELRRFLGVSLHLFKNGFPSISRQFYVESGRFFHSRVDEERAKIMARSKAQSAGARKRWENYQIRKLNSKH